MVVTLRTYPAVAINLFVPDDLLTAFAFDPQAFRNARLFVRDRLFRLFLFSEPGHDRSSPFRADGKTSACYRRHWTGMGEFRFFRLNIVERSAAIQQLIELKA